MQSFQYQRAANVGEAVDLLNAHPEAKLLAGGQTLLASLKLRLASPERLIDLGRVPELQGIRVEGSTLTIGAMTTHAAVAESAEVLHVIPALGELASQIGDPMVRRVGTLGGSLANSDPAADYPAAVLALNATVVTSHRRIPADDFFLGMFETALQPDEIIVAVAFEVPVRAAYVKFRHPASRFALVGVFVAQHKTGVRVAVTGAGPCAFRVTEMEEALDRRFEPEAVASVHLPHDGLNADLQSTAQYRAHLVSVIAQRAVSAAKG